MSVQKSSFPDVQKHSFNLFAKQSPDFPHSLSLVAYKLHEPTSSTASYSSRLSLCALRYVLFESLICVECALFYGVALNGKEGTAQRAVHSIAPLLPDAISGRLSLTLTETIQLSTDTDETLRNSA